MTKRREIPYTSEERSMAAKKGWEKRIGSSRLRSKESITKGSDSLKKYYSENTRYHSQETKEKISAGCTKYFSEHDGHWLGKKMSVEARKKMSTSRLGVKSPQWRNVNRPLVLWIRNCFEYRLWRSDVFTRDRFSCQDCGDDRGGNLRAHHFVSFSNIMQKNEISSKAQAVECEELWNINNGITLCSDCHKARHMNEKINRKKKEE